MKHLIILTLSVILVISFAACTPATEPETTMDSSSSTSVEATPTPELEQVNLIFYVLGDKPKDFDTVAAKLNEKSTADLKCTVETKFISWADFGTKYPLIFASGEKFDTIYTASWSYYVQQAVKDGFMELTSDLLAEYAPNSASQIPQEIFDQARVNDKIYMIPHWQDEYNHLGILVRGDLREKYDLPEIKTMADYENYLMTIAENEKTLIPLDTGSDFDSWTINALGFTQPQGVYLPIFGYAVDANDPNAELKKLIDIPEYISYLKKMAEFKNKGIWSKNALNNTVAGKDSFLNGKSASAMNNLITMAGVWRAATDANPEWKPELYDSMENFPTLKNSALGNGMAIFANAENPERALMWIDKVRFDQSYYDLMMYGIEGTHWIDEGEGKMSLGPNAADYNGFSNWGFNTKPSIRKNLDTWASFDTVIESWNERAINSPVFYMNFDDSNVKNEVAAVTNVMRKYLRVLELGFDSDPEKLLAEYEEQLEIAGRAKIVAEWEKQRDALLAAAN